MYDFLDIDPTAATPIWRQIEDALRRQVVSGRMPEGTAIPSVRELARTLRINPATVSKAYRRLTDAGLLTVRRGEGTFVAEVEEGTRDAERDRLLVESAIDFVRVARSVGADLEESTRSVEEVWGQIRQEGGEGEHDED
jgi:GntR family transcriptional regulator